MINVDSIRNLSKALKPVSEEQGANAAVALLLKLVDMDLMILCVKRVENPADPWSGQIALPGGKRSVEDQDLKQTVVRETLEETNVNLLDRCRFLGVMSALETRQRLGMKILPFVIILEHEPSIKLNKRELEGFFWIKLADLIQHKGTFRFGLGKFPAYVFGGVIVWGLTYNILESFVHSLNSLF